MDTIIDLAYFLCGLYSLILILIGTPANLLCFYIFKRLMPNRSNATIIVFSYLALIELLIPFAWNFNYVTRELVFKRQKTVRIKNLEQLSLFVCKLISYFAYFLLQSAAWLKTLATVVRCVSLHHDWNIRKFLVKSRVIHRLSWLTILLIGLLNLPVWFINGKRVRGLDKLTNQSQVEIKCYQSKLFFQCWEILHLLLYNFLPFAIMIFCNVSIIQHVRQSRRRTQRSKLRSRPPFKPSLPSTSSSFLPSRRFLSTNGSRLSKTLISLSMFFILSTSPAAIFYISLGKTIQKHRNLITMALSNLATTCHVLSFFIYWLTSTDFQDVVISFYYNRPLTSPRQTNQEENTLEQRTSFPQSDSFEKQKHAQRRPTS